MGQYTSYYLYQKYEKRGNQDWVPVYPNVFSVDADGTKLKNIKSENDTNCGYVPEYDPIYRWAVAPGYICDTCPSSTATTTYCKYQKEVYQVSYDNGVTYSNVTPESARTGSLIEANSYDCGYSFIERWVNSGTTCDGYDKYYLQVKQISEDGGSTWITTDVTRTGSLIEANSTDCGYDYTNQYLTFIPRQNPTKFAFNGKSATNLKYSLDSGATWNDIALSAETPYVAVGQKIMWKADAIETLNLENSSTLVGTANFYSTCGYQYDVVGNVMSLISGDSFTSATTITNSHQFDHLFFGEPIVYANNLKLPATTLSTYCYKNMFDVCTSLTAAPQLPAITMTEGCYMSMFTGCASLTTAPVLNASILAIDCYRSMFQNCGLTTAPELPVMTLTEGCYRNMFVNCTSLTTAPVLSATTLVNRCYQYMFNGCTRLNYIKCLATDISATLCTSFWVSNVPASGTFVKNSSMTSWPTGTSGIPSGWTIQDA